MISIRKLIYFALFIFLFGGCKDPWEHALAHADESLLYGNDPREWKLIQEINSAWATYYTLRKIDGDTVKVLFINQGRDGKVQVSGFRKAYKSLGPDSAFLEMRSQDTLFFYRLKNDRKVFEVGEYAYRFAHFEMDSVEATFYLKYEDSLRQVKGNGLPKLRD